MNVQDLQFDFMGEEFILSNYAPVNVEISSPSDSGDYLVNVQTQNKKLSVMLEETDFSHAVKTTVIRNLGNIDQFFAHIEVVKLDDLEDGLKQYNIHIKSIR